MFKKFLKKRQTEPLPNPTLKHRTAILWKWFSENAEEFHQAINDQNFDNYSEEFAAKIDEILPDISWVFGPGPDEEGHSLTLSPEADPYKGAAIAYIVANAPQLKGWTFYSSRQPSESFATMSMEIADETITAKQIWVTPRVDEEAEEIDLVCWAPVFESLPEDARGQITFLWLDEALGELNVTHRLGSIDIHGNSLENAMPLSELPEFITETEKKHQWRPIFQGETYSTYKFRERTEFDPTFLRSDIFAGTSLLHRLSSDHIKEDGKLENPLPDWGVDFLFVSIPKSFFTKGSEVDERAGIEDAIQELFDSTDSGRVLGGASGHENLYIDLVIFDGKNGINATLEALSRHAIGKSGKVFYFDKERATKPIG